MEAVRLTVEAWAPEFGGAMESGALDPSGASVDPNVELPSVEWQPLQPQDVYVPGCVHFTDGVRRIDARIWISAADGTTSLGLCASYAAGVVTCDGRAEVAAAEVRRGLFAPAGAPALGTRAGVYEPMAVAGQDVEQLSVGIQQRMAELEVSLAEITGLLGAGQDQLVVVDGPLRGRQHLTNAIGYIKTHQVGYLPDALTPVVTALTPGQRTPLFVTQSTWSRYSWYTRLPCEPGHPWAGIVRCEASADLTLNQARLRADQAALALPQFAAKPHKDPRAPQNLYPIGALERELRRRLGDAAFVYRALRVGASGWSNANAMPDAAASLAPDAE